VLDQNDELKLHFQLSKVKCRSFNAKILFQMYSDSVNKLYLLFLQPIVQEANRVNKMFELEKKEIHAISELNMFCLNLL